VAVGASVVGGDSVGASVGSALGAVADGADVGAAEVAAGSAVAAGLHAAKTNAMKTIQIVIGRISRAFLTNRMLRSIGGSAYGSLIGKGAQRALIWRCHKVMKLLVDSGLLKN
jgi:hypothetical protein